MTVRPMAVVRSTPRTRIAIAGPTVFITIASVILLGVTGIAQTPTNTILTIPELVKQKATSVVNISTFDASGKVDKQGSGFVVDSLGTIVTAFHMLRGAASVAVKTHDGEIYDTIDIVQYDVRRDLAVVRINPYRPLHAIPFAGDDELTIGENAAAISNPQGLDASVSAGIVSGYRQAEGFRLIQTTAPVSPGSSGGPLFNMSGNVIGMVASQIDNSQAQNLNFAVPVIYIRTLLKADRTRISLRELGKLASDTPSGRTSGRGVLDSLPPQALSKFSIGNNVTASLLGCFADESKSSVVCATELEAPTVGRYGVQVNLSRARMMQSDTEISSADVGSDLSTGLLYLGPTNSIIIRLSREQRKVRMFLRFPGRPVNGKPPRVEVNLMIIGNSSTVVANLGFSAFTPVDGGRDAVRMVFDAPPRQP